MMTKSLRTLSLAVLAIGSPLSAEMVRGVGSSAISKDLESVRTRAETAARHDLVVQMLKATIGADRLRELSPAAIDALSSQIRDDMITNRKSERDGQTFIVNLDADIDGAWFRTLLNNEGVQSSSERAAGNRQLIFVMLDQSNGAARDLSAPQEVSVEYDRSTGGSFSDKSAQASARKDASGATSRNSAAYRADEAAASGISTANGAAAGRYHGSSAGGYSGSSSSAAMHSSASASQTNVQAEVHDNERYREHVVYQKPAQNSPAGYALSALTENLGQYDVAMADPDQALAAFFGGSPPMFDALSKSARFAPFLASLAQRNAPFFMGGGIAIRDAGRDAATGLARCSGQLNARAFATSNSQLIASGAVTGDMTGSDFESCEGKLADSLARGVAAKLGPSVQNYWRRIAMANVGLDTRQSTEYALVLRASALDMSMQADILDALQSTPGVEAQNFVSQAGTEMRFTVRYAGAIPLQLALYQKLRSRPGFANMQSTVEGRSVLLCLSGCPLLK